MEINKRVFRSISCKTYLRFSLKVVFYLFAGYYGIPFFKDISVGISNNFFLTSVSFNLDTVFLNWNTSFPSVTVCEIYNGERIWELSEKYFGVGHDLHIDDFVGEIAFFHGTCTTCENCDKKVECPTNLTHLTNSFRSKCVEIIKDCRYKNKPFNCCEEFLPIYTDYGICYAFNSKQALRNPQAQYASDRETGVGILQFDALTDLQLYVHPPIEIPVLFSESIIRETVLLGGFKEIFINIMEVFNDVSIERLPLEERRCRLTNELTDLGKEIGIYEFYSSSTCVVECILETSFEFCNCTNHFLAPAVKSTKLGTACDYRGLTCLTEHYNELLERRKSCDCMSPCEQYEYDIIFNSEYDLNKNREVAQIRVSLLELPKQRYVRKVTKNNLDLIISVGGIAGLFFSASLIRVIEIIFLVFEFKWRKLWNFRI